MAWSSCRSSPGTPSPPTFPTSARFGCTARRGGRSTFIVAMEAMLGERPGTLGLHEISTSQFALSGVPGKTLLTATEQPEGYLKASHVPNKLICGDRIRVEEKYKSSYDV